ncbi:family 14 glycosylhydrolase [Clostridium sp. ZS2-4]|uniref:family 14 glycosylhydrolase n=1 Tax=Clostridium sp. ZS2-4 TaxID=2987703 RepID=UPI00227B3365|nr:family 14 glycosylhydrolase [Clostridium sp. ZS2-4]MCY6354251.1 family 14 glycosylhydrolase [Clostridium sp. ZS2-4]
MVKVKLSKLILKKTGCFIASILMFSSLFVAGKPVNAYAQTSSSFTSNVMAPLHVNDWNEFKNELNMAKDMSVDAVSVDVWWGDVEKDVDNQFDWTYYDSVFKAIKDSGLKIVPIMSFHQCGGNVGDTYTSYLPKWVWSKYHGKNYLGKTLDWDDLKYKSELGNASAEYLSLWIDDLIKNEYVDFMNDFENHYSSFANDFLELNISCGASGELRYPSYNSHDAGNKFSGYPNKGYLQCYSNVAQDDFRNSMLEKYNDLQGINKAWGITLTDISEIRPPMDGENFFYSSGRAYLDSQYGRDFIEWYNKELVNHGRNMINYAEQAFDNQLSNVQLGIKIPGVHWQINNDSYPRTAEINAGLVNTDFSQSNGYGYNPILKMAKEFNGKVTLHFTCLEMSDGNSEPTSAPKTLVGWVGDAAHNVGLEIKGENGLNGGNDDAWFWNNINDAIDNHYYNGLTILRINDAVYGESNRYYRDLINKH